MPTTDIRVPCNMVPQAFVIRKVYPSPTEEPYTGPRYVLGDIIRMLNIKGNVTTIASRLDDEDVYHDMVSTGGGTQNMVTVTALGFLETVLKMRKKDDPVLTNLKGWLRQQIAIGDRGIIIFSFLVESLLERIIPHILSHRRRTTSIQGGRTRG